MFNLTLTSANFALMASTSPANLEAHWRRSFWEEIQRRVDSPEVVNWRSPNDVMESIACGVRKITINELIACEVRKIIINWCLPNDVIELMACEVRKIVIDAWEGLFEAWMG